MTGILHTEDSDYLKLVTGGEDCGTKVSLHTMYKFFAFYHVPKWCIDLINKAQNLFKSKFEVKFNPTGFNVVGASKLADIDIDPIKRSKDTCNWLQDSEGSNVKSDSQSLAQGSAKPSGSKPEEKGGLKIVGPSKLPEMPSKDICNENDSLHDSEGSSAKPDSHRISNQSQPQGSAKPFVDKPEEEAGIDALGASKLPEMSSKDM